MLNTIAEEGNWKPPNKDVTKTWTASFAQNFELVINKCMNLDWELLVCLILLQIHASSLQVFSKNGETSTAMNWGGGFNSPPSDGPGVESNSQGFMAKTCVSFCPNNLQDHQLQWIPCLELCTEKDGREGRGRDGWTGLKLVES